MYPSRLNTHSVYTIGEVAPQFQIVVIQCKGMPYELQFMLDIAE